MGQQPGAAMNVQHGLYGFDGGTALICRCGHTLCVHRLDEPQPCDLEAHVGDHCGCTSFAQAQATSRMALRSVSSGAVYDDGARGKMKMEVSHVDGQYVALEYFDWPERLRFTELGRAPTYEGAVELMWRHVVASSAGRG